MVSQRIAAPPAEAARIAGVSKNTVYQLLADRKVTAKKLGRKTLVDLASLQAWLDSLPAYSSKAA
jgi:excisionase family DNA binding protein